jgi:hypothetical protein
VKKAQHLKELHDRIIRAAENNSNEKLDSTWRETEYRLDVHSTINAALIEVY